MKKYILIVKRNIKDALGLGKRTYFTKKTVYAKNKTEAAKEFSRIMKQDVPVKYVICADKLQSGENIEQQ